MTAVIETARPACGARPGEQCQTPRLLPAGTHEARVTAAMLRVVCGIEDDALDGGR